MRGTYRGWSDGEHASDRVVVTLRRAIEARCVRVPAYARHHGLVRRLARGRGRRRRSAQRHRSRQRRLGLGSRHRARPLAGSTGVRHERRAADVPPHIHRTASRARDGADGSRSTGSSIRPTSGSTAPTSATRRGTSSATASTSRHCRGSATITSWRSRSPALPRRAPPDAATSPVCSSRPAGVGPSCNPGGLWRPVFLYDTGPVQIDRLRVLCRDADDRRAHLRISTRHRQRSAHAR